MHHLSRKHLNLRLFTNPHCFISSHFSTLRNPILTSHQLHTIPSSSSTQYGFRSFSASSSTQYGFRSFSASSSTKKDPSRTQISEITNLIRGGDNDLDTKLNALNVSLSEVSLNIIFRVLNSQKVPALRFFDWIRQTHPQFCHSSDICSLVIDNCGRLDDFDSMLNLLNYFRLYEVRLNQKAFGYLPVMISSKAATKNSICKVVEVLNKLDGGSCGVSGIHALIEMLCSLVDFEMAEYVVVKTEKRLSNYSILIRGRCRKGHFEEARRVLDEMIKHRCVPNCQVFNYILSCLCKNDKTTEACQLVELMVEIGCPPDALTYEVFICYWCGHGKFDMAYEWLGKMESKGIEPRATTHAAFIKGFFKLQQYEEAHQYVIVCSDKYKTTSNMNYSLLANLHRKRGKPVIAESVLSEMIKMGLKPNFTVHMNVKKHLQHIGREDLVRNLESSYSSFIAFAHPSVDNGE